MSGRVSSGRVVQSVFGSRRVAWVVGLAVCVSPAAAVSASATGTAPGWEVTSRAYPTDLAPGGHGVVEIDVFNVGAGPSEGKLTVTDTLPPGLEATEAGGMPNFGGEFYPEYQEYLEEDEREGERERESLGAAAIGEAENRVWSCSGTTVVSCTTRPGAEGVMRPILPGALERIAIDVKVASVAPGSVTNRVTAAGGGASGGASVSSQIAIGSGTPSFGFAGFDTWFTNADGTPDTQAGSHPYEATFSLDLNEAKENHQAGGGVRSFAVELPPGLVGNPTAVPQCSREQFEGSYGGSLCPASTQIGVERAGLPGGGASFMVSIPVYNLVPPLGVPAQFGFTIFGVNILLDAKVRSGGDYGITEHIDNIGFAPIYSALTLWGVPGDERHNPQRCTTIGGNDKCGLASGAGAKPFLTLPTECSGALTTTIHATAWESASTGEATAVSHDENHAPAGYTGCEHLSFTPSLSAAPDTSAADTPAGLTTEIKVPQDGLLAAEGLAMSNLRDASVVLPEGLVLNPGRATGLAACPLDRDGVGREEAPSCPAGSLVGTAQVTTPLLADKLEGDVYVLQSEPPDVKLLIVMSGDGVEVKLVGDVNLDPVTGRLTTTFKETPEVPFTDFKLSFSGGAQAALATPTGCGVYATTADFTPWSGPLVEDVLLSNSFQISSGPAGSGCAQPLPFAPVLSAGSTTDQAGGYTDFSLLLTRADGQQRIKSLQFKTPKGLLGMLSQVPLCGEPQAAQGTCPAASQIGHTVVGAGPGPYQLYVPQAGQPPAPIYLTGGYKGAPYGLSIVVPLVVGPFTLQTQVVRARIEVDPRTTQLTVTTDALPTIIDGVPADLRTINAVIDKPGFMFNPTNCEPQAFNGTATSTEGVSAPIESHFQMGSCRSLTFKPDFKVSTSAKTSRADGASLDVKLLYPTGALGANQASSQANIHSVKVELPKQLPSRLTTLQKACTAAVFNANPSNCPAASVVGHATAITPVLPVPITGPAYFVSHGGEAFPSLIVVLQGYGVTVDLEGTTFISKAGITSSTFKQVPDVPVTSFELTLPEGPFSALAALGNLCKSKLTMPTDFVAQNGAVLDQQTKIAVTGCPKAKQATHKKKRKGGHPAGKTRRKGGRPVRGGKGRG